MSQIYFLDRDTRDFLRDLVRHITSTALQIEELRARKELAVALCQAGNDHLAQKLFKILVPPEEAEA